MSSRRTILILVTLCALTLVPAFAFRGWWVEDAAISFSYARNLAHGDGLVPFAGGERAEGFSDPLWVALLAVGQLARINPFLLSKILGLSFAAACVPIAWDIARRIRPVPTWVPLVAALLVATNAQHVIWASSGLESPLFSILLGLGIRQVLVERERGGGVTSSLFFLGLALTRTEAIVYGAFGVAVAAWLDLAHWRRAVARVALLLVPFAIFQAARYAYFALPFPLPYYAKLEPEHLAFFNFGGKSWRYLGNWAIQTGWGVCAPLVALGVLRARNRVGALLCAGFLTMTIVFAFVVHGDWMAGFRWYSLLALPIGILCALGIGALADRIPRAGILVIVPVLWNGGYVVWYAEHPLGLTPLATRARVRSFDAIAKRIHLDRPWVAVDHAMGGNTWFAPPGGRTIDWFGLTDVTFALHHGKVRGLDAAILLDDGPPRFDFVHRVMGMANSPRFQDLFIAIPRGKGRTMDDWLNRALVTTPSWPGEAHAVTYAGGQRLEGFTVRAPEVAAGGSLYVELGLSRDAANAEKFGLEVFLSGPGKAVFAANPGYGNLFPPSAWRPGEIFVGRYAFALPADLPTGSYALGFALHDGAGHVEPVVSAPEDATIENEHPIVGAGEISFPDRIVIAPTEEVRARAEADWTRAAAAAATGDCALAESAWADARARESLDEDWGKTLDRRAATPFAACWARRAGAETELASKLEDLRRARRWDVRSPAARIAGASIARDTWPLAMAARARGDTQQAFTLFDAVVTADPTRSWARRYAEEARTVLLAPRTKHAAR